jgi:hypothetical protein
MDGGHGQRVSRRARAICAPADRPETSVVTVRTPALADLLLAMASAQRQRGGLIGLPARQEQPPCEPTGGEHADRPDAEPDDRHGTRYPRGFEPGDEGQPAGRSLMRHRRPLARCRHMLS